MRKVVTPEPEGFADFWAVWQPYMRHTDGRGDARERYRKVLLDGADPSEILFGATAYITHLKAQSADERKFIPLAASWLNKEAYLDWADRERARLARIAELAERQTANVTPLRVNLPENHFSVQYARRKAAGE